MDAAADVEKWAIRMTAPIVAVPSFIPAGLEVYTATGDGVAWIQDYLDFLAAPGATAGRIRRVARVLIDAANWIMAERPDGPHVLRHTWEGYLLIACAGWDLDDVPRLLRRVDILDGWSRFQHWYDPRHWPYHAFPPTREARRRWLAQLVTQPWLDECEF